MSKTTKLTTILELRDKISSQLNKVIRSTQQVKKETERVRDAQGRLRDAQGRFVAETKRAESSFRSFSSSAVAGASRVGSAIKGMTAQLSGFSSLQRGMNLGHLAMGMGAGYGAYKLGNATLGGAMQMERDQITMNALVQDPKKAAQLYSKLYQNGLESTFSESDFINSGKGFLPLVKDIDKVDQLTKLTERLAMSNPLQGMEGATFAIREAMSGDFVSLQERFNIPRSMLKEYKDVFKGKNFNAEKQIKAFDEILNKLGFTSKFVQDVNNSASAQWEMLKSNVKTAFAKIGLAIIKDMGGAIKSVNNWLSNGNLDKFITKGGNALKSFVKFLRGLKEDVSPFIEGIKSGFRTVSPMIESTLGFLKDYKDTLVGIGSDAFKIMKVDLDDLKTTISDAIPYANDLFNDFLYTLDTVAYSMGLPMLSDGVNGLKKKLDELSPTLVSTVDMLKEIMRFMREMSKLYEAAFGEKDEKIKLKDDTIDSWFTLSGAIRAVVEAITWALDKLNDFISTVSNMPDFKFGLPEWAGGNGFIQVPKTDNKPKNNKLSPPELNKRTRETNHAIKNSNNGSVIRNGRRQRDLTAESRASGLSYVPYDGYYAYLHKGEGVLTSNENKSYQEGQGGVSVLVQGNTFNVREEEDIDKVAKKLAKYVQSQGGLQ